MAERESEYPPIGDYAIIGDCRSAALVSKEGSIDWLCWPRFDSPSLFAALLDRRRGGRFLVRPKGRFTVERCYAGDTNVLQTTFRTETGVVRLVDLMPVTSEEEKRHELWPDHQILRAVECLDGEVEVEVICEPRPRYGQAVPRLTERGKLGLFYEHRANVLILRSEIPLHLSEDGSSARGSATVKRGERRALSLAFGHGEPAVVPPLGGEAAEKIAQTLRWWRTWAGTCRYEGPYRDAVMRSALTLKLMTYAPSGAVVAAPTTSLPEEIGGVRNWDYRYCWLRDASLTLGSLYDLGYTDEAAAFLAWMLHSTRMTWPEVQVMYDVHGETRLTERQLAHLQGYAGSRPVRVGNEACQQFQLDTYGEVVEAVYQFCRRGGRLDRAAARMLAGLGRTVARRWREPDEGIWEIRGGRRHHTYSKAMCWVALDRLIRLHESGQVEVPVAEFQRERDAIREEVEARGYDERLRSYVTVYDGDDVDASLLLLGRYGYVEGGAARMRTTCARVQERLGKNGLLYRYRGADDGLPGSEGAFGICSFWAVECLAGQGAVKEATQNFEHILSMANDVGLFAEEIDPDTGAALGNFPQAFTHVGLIGAALALAKHVGEPALAGAEEAASDTKVGR